MFSLPGFSETYQSNKNILIVDDVPNNLQLLFQYLKEAGYKVLVAQDGNKALKIAESTNPNLILLDIMMSGLNGFETCMQLKKNPATKDIPIIFMTSLAQTKSKIKGFALGAVDYITKPFNRQELLARIKAQLDMQNLHQRLSKEAKTKELLFKISDCIRQSLDLNLVFQTVTEEISKIFDCDEVALARLRHEDIKLEAQFVANDTVPEMSNDMRINYLCPNQQEYQNSIQGKIRTIENIENPSSPIQAQLIIPILLPQNTVKANKFYPLWGWLIANQYSPRKWTTEENKLCQSVTAQLAIAIHQDSLYHQAQQSNQQLQKSNQQLKQINQKLQQLALLDPLTQIFNRRYFDQQINLEWRKLKRHQDRSSSISLIMCDVDCFKIYNDTYGHQKGDECLKQVVSALSKVLKRPADILARYGGEEFVIALPNTSEAGVIKLAELMRVAVKNLKISHVNSTVDSVVTISLGVASTIPNSQNTPASLIAAADKALYLAKERGRDCFAVYQPEKIASLPA